MDLTLLARERVGKVLRGKYHLDRLIDVGGMAAVYEATHRNGTRSAIKVLHPKYVSDVQARTRFLREGYAANHVGHPGSVTVIDDQRRVHARRSRRWQRLARNQRIPHRW